jgi:hypothetical protein
MPIVATAPPPSTIEVAVGDRGIIFSGESIRAIIAGRKTQTRRIVKLPPRPTFRGGWEPDTIGGDGCFAIRKGQRVPVPETVAIYNKTTGTILACPFGLGDRLYVKEILLHTDVLVGDRGVDEVRYAADNVVCPYVDRWPWKGGTLSPMFMPRGARRFEITISGLAVQRLNDISEADAKAEGVLPQGVDPEGDCWTQSYRAAYEHAWNEINGWLPNSWETNPWVWCLSFTVKERDDG